MKRSEINSIIASAQEFFNLHQFHLPSWAQWEPCDWEHKGTEIDEIIKNRLGWDVTDFGSGDFYKRGLFLFTLRNGNPAFDRKPYAEKIMIVEEHQETPMHFHRVKMEDIINRGGGKLVIELYASDPGEDLSDKEFTVSIDGIRRRIRAGEKICLSPGESICLEPYMYHRFWAEDGKTLVGEVSVVNDDLTDNRFHEGIGRFPAIEEDCEALRLLVSDYDRMPCCNKNQ